MATTISDKKNIELVVFKCFIRVIKNDGKYMMFRNEINNDGIMKYLVRKKRGYDSSNPFSSSRNTNDIVRTLVDITNKMAISNGTKNGIKGLDNYEHVTITINHLLHFFLEKNGLSMDKLSSLGEMIYGLSCSTLFGDEIDETNSIENIEAKITSPADLKHKLFCEYMVGIKCGSIDNSIKFEDYLKQHAKEFDRFGKNALNDMERGYMLGRGPEEIPEGARNMFRQAPAWEDEDNELWELT